MWISNVVVKLLRLVLQVEMSWYHSLVLSAGQYVVTLLSKLGSCRLNMDILCASTSGPSIYLCMGILWLCWDCNWKIPLCLFLSFQLIAQHLEWLITSQVVVRRLVLVKNMNKPLFHHWWLNPPFWHVFVRLHGIHQMLKWGSWLVRHVGVILSFIWCLNMDLISSIKAQKSSLDWWCCLFVSKCCCMKSIMLSFLLILGPKRCMLCCLLVCGGHRYKNHVREFEKSVRFVNMLKISYKHPRFTRTFTYCWSKVWILVNGLYYWVTSICKWL